MVDGHELGAVRERPLDLHLVDQLGHSLHHLAMAEHLAPDVHQLGDTAPLADELEQLRRDQRDGLGVAQPEPAGESLLRDHPRAVQDELVELPRGQVHGARDLPTNGG